MRRGNLTLVAALAVLLAGTACDQAGQPTSPALARAATDSEPYGVGDVSSTLDSINTSLRSRGLGIQIARAEISLTPDQHYPARNQVVFTNDRALRLTSRWVPGDTRRAADGNRLTWLDLDPLMQANTGGTPLLATPAVDAAFQTWSARQCSTLQLEKRAWGGTTNPSILLDFGLPPDPFAADVSVIGYLPGAVFDQVLGPGSSSSVLGVTFTFVFIDGNGAPTDVDHDGRNDTALKEMWFNNAFAWGTSGTGSAIDAETVALHEIGHALELGHFGKIFGTVANLKLHVSPRAVMNAVILGTLRSPLGSDNAAFCGNFASWP